MNETTYRHPIAYKDIKVGNFYCHNDSFVLVVKIIQDDNKWIHVHYLNCRGQLRLRIGVPDTYIFYKRFVND